MLLVRLGLDMMHQPFSLVRSCVRVRACRASVCPRVRVCVRVGGGCIVGPWAIVQPLPPLLDPTPVTARHPGLIAGPTPVVRVAPWAHE